MSGSDAEPSDSVGDAPPRDPQARPCVFISHSSIDTWIARQLGAHIQQCGADIFLDEADIEHGDDFEERIHDAEERCSELVVLLTPWAMTRAWVWIEISFFKHSRKRIVGILHGVSVDEIATHPHAAILLRKLDLVDIHHVDSYFDQLKRRIQAATTRGSDA